MKKRIKKQAKRKMKYSKNEMIRLLKRKAKRLGRVPYKREIENDKQLPSYVTYLKYFGSYPEFIRKIGLQPVRYLSKTELKEHLIKFAKKHKKIPTQTEFCVSGTTASTSKIYGKIGMTWNQLLAECGLPILSRGNNYLSRKAELTVKNILISAHHDVEDMTVENNLSPYSFKIDNTVRIHVSGSSLRVLRPRDSKKIYKRWGFQVPEKRKFDFMVGVGFNSKVKPVAVYVFPRQDIHVKNIKVTLSKKSKYSWCRLKRFNQLSTRLGLRKKK